ncbi:MAG: hypothetical protein QOF76_3192 [Solirubrobacteraceae bacterium]|jgi:uncharacterized RDD family membrane protein YckC|nr:hypothetical protein [Solirubrobacteraceae bacterium]
MDPTKVVGRRVVALLLDIVLISAINLGIFFALAKDPVAALNRGDIENSTTIYFNFHINDKIYSVYGGTASAYFLVTFLIGIVYFVVLPGTKGWTPGKLLTGIRVQKEDGSVTGIGRALGRWFLWIADAFPYIIPYLTGFICALTSDKHQRLGDRVAGSVVVHKEAFGSPVGAVVASGAAGAPPPLAPEFQPGTAASPPNWPS